MYDVALYHYWPQVILNPNKVTQHILLHTHKHTHKHEPVIELPTNKDAKKL